MEIDFEKEYPKLVKSSAFAGKLIGGLVAHFLMGVSFGFGVLKAIEVLK